MVLDTCALLWWIFSPEKLSKNTLNLLAKDTQICVSNISLLEIGTKVAKKKLQLPLSLNAFHKKLSEVLHLRVFPIDDQQILQSVQLDWDHKDPADRIIVSLATQLGIPIVTSDRAIHSFYRSCLQ